MDNSSLAHSKWNCKYHIVFASKYKIQIIYGKIKADIGVDYQHFFCTIIIRSFLLDYILQKSYNLMNYEYVYSYTITRNLLNLFLFF